MLLIDLYYKMDYRDYSISVLFGGGGVNLLLAINLFLCYEFFFYFLFYFLISLIYEQLHLRAKHIPNVSWITSVFRNTELGQSIEFHVRKKWQPMPLIKRPYPVFGPYNHPTFFGFACNVSMAYTKHFRTHGFQVFCKYHKSNTFFPKHK